MKTRWQRGAWTDVAESAEFIARTNLDAAIRFIRAVKASVREISRLPGLGSPKFFTHEKLAGMRPWRVRGFPKHLIFYSFTATTVYIAGVLHGSRDVEHILEDRA